MKIAIKQLYFSVSVCCLFLLLVAFFSSSISNAQEGFGAGRRGAFAAGDMRMPGGERTTMENQKDPNIVRQMPGRDFGTNPMGEMGNPSARPRMPNRFMGGGSFENRAYSAESAGQRPSPGGMHDNMHQHAGVFPENEHDREEAERKKDADGMGGWAKTKKPGVKVDTSFREKMQQMQNNPFMQQPGKSRSRHAENAYPNDMTGGGESNLRRKRDGDDKPKKKKKSKVPAKPGHVKAGSNKRHYSREEADGEGPAGSAKGQHCFKKASSVCSGRVMQENFGAYTKCIFENRKSFGTDCEDWAGAQGACMRDMVDKCPKQNPARTTKCLKEQAAKGELTNACRDSTFFKSLEQGFGKFNENYNAAGGENVFEHNPQEFMNAGAGEGAGAGAGAGGGMPNANDFMKEAYNDAKSSFTAADMESIKKAALESILKGQKNQNGGDARRGFPGDAEGGSAAGGPQSVPRERQLEGGAEKLKPIDDL